MSYPVLQRFEQAKKYDPKGYNCIGAAYFLMGLDERERYREPGKLEEKDPRLRRVSSLSEAHMIGLELTYEECKGDIEHLAVIHPLDRSKVIERGGPHEEIIEQPLDSLLWYDRRTKKLRTVLFSVDGIDNDAPAGQIA